jgi:metal-sulfur cluster biosynthetic enzyme
VRAWSVTEAAVHVTLSPTSPSCTLIGSIIEGVERRVSAVPGVASVTVELDTETFWTAELMSAEGKRKLAGRRAGSMERVPIRPRQWREYELPVVTPR